MTSIEEIRAGIQEKSIERELGVKKILADIKKKRKLMDEYKKRMITFSKPPIMPKKIKKPKVVKKKPPKKPKKHGLKEEILDVMGINEHRTMDFLIEKLNKPKDTIESSLQDLVRENRVLEREVEAYGRNVSLWMRKE